MKPHAVSLGPTQDGNYPYTACSIHAVYATCPVSVERDDGDCIYIAFITLHCYNFPILLFFVNLLLCLI